MTKLVFLKAIIGSSVLVGSATTGTYFGSKTTIEQYLLNNDGNLKKISLDNKWQENFGKISKSRDSSDSDSEIQSPQSEVFKKIASKIKEWTDLKKECYKELEKTYKVFWISGNSIESKLEADLKAYCFSK